jgi:Uma2 family endonuclease
VRETAMKTVEKIGPADHDRPMTLEEFHAASTTEGYQYELIDGSLYVSPLPNLPQGLIEAWILTVLSRYSWARPDVINFVYGKARVYVPGRPGVTNPEPDVTAYRDFPLDVPFGDLSWQDVSPILVVEVLSLDDPKKDLERNVELYLQVPSIKEYWVLDSRPEGADRPHLRVYRRWRRQWRQLQYAPGATYTTRLLPDFALVVDPHR